jgi:hypothetical protein
MKIKYLNFVSIKVGLTLFIGVVLEFAIILSFNRSFFIQDDSGVSGYPLLKFVGQELLAGNDPFFIPEIWTSGNIWAEAQFGLFNPISYLFFALAAIVDSILINAVIWKFFYTLMLAWGAYRLFRAHQIEQNLAMLLALTLPISGYILYFDMAAWGIELLGFAWLFHFWASLENHLNGKATGLQLLIPAWLLVSSGYPYALFPLVYLIPWFIYREFKKIKRVSLSSFFLYASLGLLAIATYLPSLLSSSVNSRGDGGFINSGSWSISIGRNLFGLASPTLFPDLQTNGPPNFTNAPVFYLSIIFVALLPFLYVAQSRFKSTEFVVIAMPLVMTSVAMSLPSNFWMFRWPFRFLPVFAVCILLLVGWLITNGSIKYAPKRFKIGLGAIFFVFFSSVVINPSSSQYHLVASMTLLLTLIFVAFFTFKNNERVVYLSIFVGSAFTLMTQLWYSPTSLPLRDYNSPGVVSEVFVDNHKDDLGNILQVADFNRMSKSSIDDRDIWNEVLLGSWPALSGIPILNSYSASGFEAFDKVLCLTANGSTCPAGFTRLSSTFSGYDANLGELLGINTVVIQVSNQDKPFEPAQNKQWKLENCREYTCTYKRIIPIDSGIVSSAPKGLSLQAQIIDSRNSVFTLSGNADHLLIRRLNWPGYSAKIGNTEIGIKNGPAGLVELDLPERDLKNEKLELNWEIPGLKWIRISIFLSLVTFLTMLVILAKSRTASNSQDLQ